MKVTGVELKGAILLIHYVNGKDEIVDERIVAIRWKKNPVLIKVVQAFAEVVSTYVLTNNKNLDKLETKQLEQLFEDLLNEDLPG